MANSLGAAVRFAGITLFARHLTAAQIGVFFLFEALLALGALPADVGIKDAVEKRISEQQDPGTILATGAVLKAVPLSATAGLVLALEQRVNQFIGAEVAMFLAVTLVLQGASRLLVASMRGMLRVEETAVYTLLRHGAWFLGGGVLVYLQFGAVGLVLGATIASAVTLLWAAWKTSIVLGRPARDRARSLFEYSRFAFVSNLGTEVYSWIDVVIIGFLLTRTAVGRYQIAWQVSVVVVVVSTSIVMAVFPQVSAWDARDATEKVESVLSSAIVAASLVSIPAFFGALVLSREILGIVFGPEYAAAWLVLIVLTGEKIIQALLHVVGTVLSAIDRPRLAARATVVSIALNIVLNVVLVWRFGILGAAVATAVAFGAGTLLHLRYLSRFLSVRIPFAELAWCTFAAAVMAAVVYVARRVAPPDSLQWLFALVGLGVVVYSLTLLCSPPIRMWMAQNMPYVSRRVGS